MAVARPVAILGGVRIPFCRQNTAYADVGNLGMSVRTLGALVERYGLHGQQLGEVAMGAVIKHSSDWNLGREAALSSGLSPLTPGITLQRACGTSLDSIITVANKIALGQIELGIGGGSDTTSEVPIVYGKKLRARLLAANRAKTTGDKIRALTRSFKFAELKPEFPGVAEPRTGKSMGDHCEDMAKQWNIARDSQDAWAVSSHHKLAAAYERGFFADLIAPFRGVERDNILRADTSLEKLATLKPAFDKVSGRGTLTAANSTPLTDGAAAVLLASEQWAQAHGHVPMAYLRDAQVAAVDFVHGEGLLMAPTIAVPDMLKRHGLSLQDFDIYEIHEAFAAQVLCTLRAWESEDYCRTRLGLEAPLGQIDPAKINPLGSSLATGHPFAATGARIVATVAKQLVERGGGRALISICTAGGMGVVAIVER
ncbi:acetyl-CoA C-acetyltransferase [Xanthomonas graminis]|jgi:acetyl-CoA C-acetyltransferase|uniref:Acetyl-CoA acetyltransferase n=1 Tax=Xanthomonas graminis pv. graminis TaxID=134874 RepID=A0A1M4L8I2_9XANT|nr:acetyl-CoA C-acetyltransferase [Xanthomonas translucens]EKU23611.1 acetyl-CoA C-acyltransferase [Xanthomonas translucens pv. graminis ART-Xtg29]OAX58684.1 acetyl-CoA acetyltransferase [Xanthomonas translucens pv. graminis]UKE54355.1 acetyl-CoA C-acetyltransferase [Xanthomonas translucens pv. graminis]WIH08827.1 acetyl-CoA C-acetyltransferase [Xanthomonas translucens pv. graminis]WIH12262.1 acetyl-CoA C-acetyltransferase [Xanthomonas translucens pv. graminis]